MDLLKLKNNQSGYTLLEVLTSFAVFTILLGIIVFGFRDTRNIERYRDSVVQFVNNVKKVQNWALTGKEIDNDGNEEVPIGGYGIHMNLFRAGSPEGDDLEEGDNQFVLFADLAYFDPDPAVSDCVEGGNQRYDTETFKSSGVEECKGPPSDFDIGLGNNRFGENVKVTKVFINYSDSLLPDKTIEYVADKTEIKSADLVLDIAFQNFKPFPYVGIYGCNACRDPEDDDYYDSERINILDIYFVQEGLEMCKKVTISGASGLIEENTVTYAECF